MPNKLKTRFKVSLFDKPVKNKLSTVEKSKITRRNSQNSPWRKTNQLFFTQPISHDKITAHLRPFKGDIIKDY